MVTALVISKHTNMSIGAKLRLQRYTCVTCGANRRNNDSNAPVTPQLAAARSASRDRYIPTG